MSYCRWSDNDHMCDVYVYEDVAGGWTTHVAGRRVIYKEALPEIVSFSAGQAWWDRKDRVSEMFDKAERVDIGLPHDGESFSDDDPGECADRLESLREIGYLVPQYAIDALRAEQTESRATKPLTPTNED